jgi:hypothetical protein
MIFICVFCMFWKLIFIFVLCMLVVPRQFQTHRLSKDNKNIYHPTTWISALNNCNIIFILT